VRPSGYTGNDFEIVVDGPLTLGRTYNVVAEFFVRHSAEDLADAVRLGLDRYARSLSPSDDFLDSELESQIETLLEARFIGRKRKWLNVSTLGQCPDRAAAPRLLRELTNLQRTALAGLVEAHRELGEAQANERRALHEFEDPRPPGYGLSRQLLKSVPDEARNPGYSDQAVDSLFDLFLDKRLPSAEQIDRWEHILDGGGVRNRLTQEQRAAVTTMVARADRLLDRRADVADASRALSEARDSLDAETGSLTGILNPGYRPAANAVLTSVSFADTAQYRKLRISTAFATGAVALGGSGFDGYLDGDAPGDVEYQALNLIVTKFYLGPVDKELPDPYPDGLSHFALNVGAAVGTSLSYGGEELKDAFASLKPVLGLSYDFSRFFAAHAGMVFFRQPEPNPFDAQRRGRTAAALYLALGFDFDVVNGIRELVKKGGS
jgi:hypothetical protein